MRRALIAATAVALLLIAHTSSAPPPKVTTVSASVPVAFVAPATTEAPTTSPPATEPPTTTTAPEPPPATAERIVVTTAPPATEPPPTEPPATDPPAPVEIGDAEVIYSTGDVNGYPCGGDLPPCYVLARESGGNPEAQNAHSTASGLWQFLDSTWNGYGGFAKARYAPPDVQNQKAREVWNHGAGCSAWSAC